jgi:hypothetical protein
MKLLSKSGISVAPPACKTSTSTPLPAELTSTASTAAPAPASAAPATSLAVPTAVSAAVPATAAIVFAAASVISDISPTVHASNIATTNKRLVTPDNEPDITMESPPPPEGSSRATRGPLRN